MRRLKNSGLKKLLISLSLGVVLSEAAFTAPQEPSPEPQATVAAQERQVSKEKVLDILKKAKEAARGIQEHGMDRENLAREIAEAQAEAGDVNAAMTTVLTNPKYRDLLLSKIAVSEANAGEMKAAFETLKTIQAPAERIRAQAGIATAYYKVGLSVKGDEVFAEAVEETRLPEARSEKGEFLKLIAKAQSDVGDFRGAYLTFNRIPDAVERARILRNLVKLQIQSGSFKLAREIAEVIEKGENKSAAFKDIAVGLAKKKWIKEALETVREIEDDYYKGSALAKIAEVQAKAGQTAEAKGNFYEAKKIAKSIHDDAISQAMVLNDIAQSQWFSGNAADSRDSFQEAKQATLSIKENMIEKSLMLKDIALAEWSCGRRTESKQTFQESKQAALAIPVENKFYNRPIALRALAEALTKTGDQRMAGEVVEEAKKTVLSIEGNFQDKSTLLSTMADSELEAGNFKAAVPLLQHAAQMSLEIPDAEQKAWSLTDIAIYQSRANDLNGALQTLQKAQQAAFKVQDEVQRTAVLMNITISYVRLGFINAALQLADNSSNYNEKAEVLGRITATQVKEGEFDDAMKLANDQNSALFKTRALIGIARGMLENSAKKKMLLDSNKAEPPKEEEAEESSASGNVLVLTEEDVY